MHVIYGYQKIPCHVTYWLFSYVATPNHMICDHWVIQDIELTILVDNEHINTMKKQHWIDHLPLMKDRTRRHIYHQNSTSLYLCIAWVLCCKVRMLDINLFTCQCGSSWVPERALRNASFKYGAQKHRQCANKPPIWSVFSQIWPYTYINLYQYSQLSCL